MEKFAYSLNEEDFFSLDEILDKLEDEDGDDATHVYKGTCVHYKHSDFFSADDIIEEMTDRAYQEGDDFSDNYCSELELKEHKEKLTKIVLEYLDANVAQPSFYTVKDVVKMTVEEFKKDVA